MIQIPDSIQKLTSTPSDPRCASDKEVNHSVVRVSYPPRDLLYRIREKIVNEHTTREVCSGIR